MNKKCFICGNDISNELNKQLPIFKKKICKSKISTFMCFNQNHGCYFVFEKDNLIYYSIINKFSEAPTNIWHNLKDCELYINIFPRGVGKEIFVVNKTNIQLPPNIHGWNFLIDNLIQNPKLRKDQIIKIYNKASKLSEFL
jgi:hypothetical protein